MRTKHPLLLLVLLAIISYGSSYAQYSTTKIPLKPTDFWTEFERANYEKLIGGGPIDTFATMVMWEKGMTTEKAAELKQNFDEYYEKQLAPLAKGKTKQEHAAAMFSKLETGVLKNFSPSSDFEELIPYGNYGLMNATALFSYFLYKADIPLKIEGSIVGVDIIAMPGQGQVKQAIKDGNDLYVEDFKALEVPFVSYLELVKLAPTGSAQTNKDFYLQKYMYVREGLTPVKMAAYGYFFTGLRKLSVDPTASMQSVQKAFNLHNSLFFEMTVFSLLASYIEQQEENMDDSTFVDCYLIMTGFLLERDKEHADEQFPQLLQMAAAKYLEIDKPNLSGYISMAEYVLGKIKHDKTQHNEAKAVHLYNLVSNNITQGKYIEAYKQLMNYKCAGDLKPGDENYDELEDEIVTGGMEEKEGFVDSVRAVNRQLPAACKDSALLYRLELVPVFYAAKKAFENGQSLRGDSLIMVGERMLKTKGIKCQEAANALLSISNDYYFKEDFTKARTYTQKALKYCSSCRSIKEQDDFLVVHLNSGYTTNPVPKPPQSTNKSVPKPPAPQLPK